MSGVAFVGSGTQAFALLDALAVRVTGKAAGEGLP